MGMRPKGILAYGYDLGGPEAWKLQGADEYGEYEFPHWYNPDSEDGFEEQATNRLLYRLTGFDETWGDVYGTPQAEDFYHRQAVELKKIRVELVMYASADEPGFVLATQSFVSPNWASCPVEISTDHAAAGILDVALAALEIQPLQEEPKWILASYYG